MCITQRMGSSLTVIALLGSMVLCNGCGDPALNGLDPNSGAPHTLVELNSSDYIFTSIYWDAGTAGETQVPGWLLGGGPFSVPHGIGLGIHDVQLRRSSGSSPVRNFTVTDPAAAPFPVPRLEYISISGWEEPTPGNAKFFIFSHGADIDVGAEILVDGAAQETVLWRALRYNNGGIDPTTLNYPVYHYAMMVTAVEAGIPVPCFSTALAFFDGYRTERLPANLLQAQRDFFGAHTYERVDQPRGKFFHTNWTGTGGTTTSSSYNV